MPTHVVANVGLVVVHVMAGGMAAWLAAGRQLPWAWDWAWDVFLGIFLAQSVLLAICGAVGRAQQAMLLGVLVLAAQILAMAGFSMAGPGYCAPAALMFVPWLGQFVALSGLRPWMTLRRFRPASAAPRGWPLRYSIRRLMTITVCIAVLLAVASFYHRGGDRRPGSLEGLALLAVGCAWFAAHSAFTTWAVLGLGPPLPRVAIALLTAAVAGLAPPYMFNMGQRMYVSWAVIPALATLVIVATLWVFREQGYRWMGTMQRVELDDVSLHVTVRGSGRPVLLVHGFPLDHTMWKHQLDFLDQNCLLIAPDLRGFGKSVAREGIGPDEKLTMEQHANDLARALDVLRIDEPVVYCGLSMGGYIAWQFFRRHRDKVAALILCDTRAIADAPEAAEARLQTAAQVQAEGNAALVEGMLPKLFADATRREEALAIQPIERVMRETDSLAVAAALRGMAERPDATPLLGAIDVPTLVVVGEHDAISTVDEMRGIAESISGAKFCKIDRAGHMAPFEQPVAFNNAVRKFLRGL